jgi:hypothetical protein
MPFLLLAAEERNVRHNFVEIPPEFTAMLKQLWCFSSFGVHTEELSRNSLLVLNLDKRRLEEQAWTLGRLLFAELRRAMFSRQDLRPFALYCDEIQRFVTYERRLDVLLSEARKFGISVLMATQFLNQRPAAMRSAMLLARTNADTIAESSCFESFDEEWKATSRGSEEYVSRHGAIYEAQPTGLASRIRPCYVHRASARMLHSSAHEEKRQPRRLCRHAHKRRRIVGNVLGARLSIVIHTRASASVLSSLEASHAK